MEKEKEVSSALTLIVTIFLALYRLPLPYFLIGIAMLSFFVIWLLKSIGVFSKISEKLHARKLRKELPSLIRKFNRIIDDFDKEFLNRDRADTILHIISDASSAEDNLGHLMKVLSHQGGNKILNWFYSFKNSYFRNRKWSSDEFIDFVREFQSILQEYDAIIEEFTHIAEEYKYKLPKRTLENYKKFRDGYQRYWGECDKFVKDVSDALEEEIRIHNSSAKEISVETSDDFSKIAKMISLVLEKGQDLFTTSHTSSLPSIIFEMLDDEPIDRCWRHFFEFQVQTFSGAWNVCSSDLKKVIDEPMNSAAFSKLVYVSFYQLVGLGFSLYKNFDSMIKENPSLVFTASTDKFYIDKYNDDFKERYNNYVSSLEDIDHELEIIGQERLNFNDAYLKKAKEIKRGGLME